MSVLVQFTPFARTFILVSSTDHVSPLTGASPLVAISKNGGAFAAPQGAVTEVSNGWYVVSLTPSDVNTVGSLSYHITAAGGDDTDFSDQVIAAAATPIP